MFFFNWKILFSALRVLTSWCESREVFNDEAAKIRAEFDANKNFDSGNCTEFQFFIIRDQINYCFLKI
jgi:hypothetical protein